jgi:glycosyltransferase involved in cell wall biosynthesis
VVTPSLTVVVPTLGRSPALGEVLAGLGLQHADDFEVVVVLDALAASKGCLESPRLVRVHQAQRPGASAARNCGWQAARSPLVLFLDDDIVPAPQLVAEHLAWHRKHPEPEVGVLGSVRWASRVTVTPFMRWLERGIQFDYGTIDSVDVGWQRFYSCNVSVKRSLLERTGGFDEERFPYGYEDLELARRMWSTCGLRLLYNQNARAEHLKTETLEGWRRNLKRIAVAERRFTELYPEERPYFYERFRAAAQAPAARGRSARLARFVPPGFPWLGRFVWRSFDLACSQRLAGEFLAEWEQA